MLCSVNAGDAPTQKILVRINGSRGSVQMFNHTTGVGWTYNASTTTGQWVDVDVDAYTAKNQAGIDMAGSITHTGAAHWMELRPGVNDIEIISASGTGTITLAYSNAFL